MKTKEITVSASTEMTYMVRQYEPLKLRVHSSVTFEMEDGEQDWTGEKTREFVHFQEKKLMEVCQDEVGKQIKALQEEEED